MGDVRKPAGVAGRQHARVDTLRDAIAQGQRWTFHLPENRVQTLDRSVDILEELSRSNPALGVTTIAKRLSLGKSTVHRTLQTLCWRGYVARERKTIAWG